MAVLTWNDIGEKLYESGIDRTVFYVASNPGFAWNGVAEISEEPSGGSAQPHYIDGVKFLNTPEPEEFEDTLWGRVRRRLSEELPQSLYATWILPLEPVPTATALTWMMERYLNRSLGRQGTGPGHQVLQAHPRQQLHHNRPDRRERSAGRQRSVVQRRREQRDRHRRRDDRLHRFGWSGCDVHHHRRQRRW